MGVAAWIGAGLLAAVFLWFVVQGYRHPDDNRGSVLFSRSWYVRRLEDGPFHLRDEDKDD